MLLSSLSYVRRHYFEVFYKLHIVCGTVSFVALSQHFSYGKLDVATPFLLLMLGDYAYRALRCLRGDATVVATSRFADTRSGRRLACGHRRASAVDPFATILFRAGTRHSSWRSRSRASGCG
jgi:hypothetical protein